VWHTGRSRRRSRFYVTLNAEIAENAEIPFLGRTERGGRGAEKSVRLKPDRYQRSVTFVDPLPVELYPDKISGVPAIGDGRPLIACSRVLTT